MPKPLFTDEEIKAMQLAGQEPEGDTGRADVVQSAVRSGILLPLAVRLGGSMAAGSAANVPLVGPALGAVLGGGTEAIAQKLEGGDLNWPRIVAEGGLSAIPGVSMMKAAKNTAQAVKRGAVLGTALAGAGVVARRATDDEVRGKSLSERAEHVVEKGLPDIYETTSLVVGGLGGAMGGKAAQKNLQKAGKAPLDTPNAPATAPVKPAGIDWEGDLLHGPLRDMHGDALANRLRMMRLKKDPEAARLAEALLKNADNPKISNRMSASLLSQLETAEAEASGVAATKAAAKAAATASKKEVLAKLNDLRRMVGEAESQDDLDAIKGLYDELLQKSNKAIADALKTSKEKDSIEKVIKARALELKKTSILNANRPIDDLEALGYKESVSATLPSGKRGSVTFKLKQEDAPDVPPSGGSGVDPAGSAGAKAASAAGAAKKGAAAQPLTDEILEQVWATAAKRGLSPDDFAKAMNPASLTPEENSKLALFIANKLKNGPDLEPPTGPPIVPPPTPPKGPKAPKTPPAGAAAPVAGGAGGALPTAPAVPVAPTKPVKLKVFKGKKAAAVNPDAAADQENLKALSEALAKQGRTLNTETGEVLDAATGQPVVRPPVPPPAPEVPVEVPVPAAQPTVVPSEDPAKALAAWRAKEWLREQGASDDMINQSTELYNKLMGLPRKSPDRETTAKALQQFLKDSNLKPSAPKGWKPKAPEPDFGQAPAAPAAPQAGPVNWAKLVDPKNPPKLSKPFKVTKTEPVAQAATAGQGTVLSTRTAGDVLEEGSTIVPPAAPPPVTPKQPKSRLTKAGKVVAEVADDTESPGPTVQLKISDLSKQAKAALPVLKNLPDEELAKIANMPPTSPDDLPASIAARALLNRKQSAQALKSVEEAMLADPNNNQLAEQFLKMQEMADSGSLLGNLVKGAISQQKAPKGYTIGMNFSDPSEILGMFARDPRFTERLLGATAGAGIGAAYSDRDPLMGALTGGALGAMAPGAIRNAGQAFSKIPGSGSLDRAADLVRRYTPAVYRSNLLYDPVGLPINAVLAPAGSGATGSIEHMVAGLLDGDASRVQRGKDFFKILLNPSKYSKIIGQSYDEAGNLLANAERASEAFEPGANLFQRVISFPGRMMATGDQSIRNIGKMANFTDDEMRAMTLTSNPRTVSGRKLNDLGNTIPLLLPFHRTAINAAEGSADRFLPTAALMRYFDKKAGREVAPMSDFIARQIMGGLIGAGSYQIGQNTETDPIASAVAAKTLSNMVGQYGPIAAILFALGQGMQEGRGSESARGALEQALPLPTTQTLNDLWNSGVAFAEGIPDLVNKGQFPELHPDAESPLLRYLPRAFVPGYGTDRAMEKLKYVLDSAQGGVEQLMGK